MADTISRLSERELADLCAFADGTLARDRRPEIEAWVQTSPELLELVERQRRSLTATRALASEPVPATLGAALEAQRPATASRARRRLTFAFSGVLAALVVAFVVLTLTGGPAAPSVADAARLAVQPPSGPPPATVAGTARLAADVQGLAFPDLSRPFGWQADGVRQGRLAGRDATVVYYAKGGESVGYAIVAGPALAKPSGATSTTVDGVQFQTLSLQGRPTVTWRRLGHTCVMIGAVSPGELLALATWHAGGTESY